MTGVRFTEEMRGFASFGETDFERGYDGGSRDDIALMFRLTIEMDRPDASPPELGWRGGASGWVECHALGGRRLVDRGAFTLLVDAEEPGVKTMLYRLHFRDGVGHPLTLAGHKLIRGGRIRDVWPQTSTLYTRVLRGHVEPGHDEAAEIAASGILRIRKRDFARQLTTFRGERPADVGRFVVRFARDLLPLYTGLADRSRRP